MWMSLKKNVNCGTKVSTDVVSWPQKCSKKQKHTPGKENLDNDELHQVGNQKSPPLEVLFRPNHPRTQFHSKSSLFGSQFASLVEKHALEQFLVGSNML